MARQLALFDLDNTLLCGDSDHAWGEFLIARKLVDESSHRAENDRYYQQYREGQLDIHGYVKFTLQPILSLSPVERRKLHDEFMREAVGSLFLAKADRLVQRHKEAGDMTIIITATNEFITTPIARRFEVDQLIATELEMQGDYFTGNIKGTPCYQAGKVDKLQKWLEQRHPELTIEDATFYSDSINDLPLLDCVAQPIVVDPDTKLAQTATERGWKTISLR